ncbi:MAG: NADP-dependent isocitrate dehydrogenase, partial [Nevskiaceae bacterium]|nr:NADP-dependent isocitrate dehydrogenase [Nevskiaceae bacterium]
MSDAKIIYTLTDEAPALATWSLLPIVQAFAGSAGVRVETRDISLAGRIVANFPDDLTPAQRQNDDLRELGELAKTPQANIIKLPNISASVPQLEGAIEELQAQGYKVPAYPDAAADAAAQQVRQRYAAVLGSAVNPVLREGNSDRRVARAVKQYAQKHPHSMGAWTPQSKTRVLNMDAGDFYGNEQSAVVAKAGKLRIVLNGNDGANKVLKENITVFDGQLIASTFMQAQALREFYARAIDTAGADGVLVSLHLKATMMKVSDPIMFGHAVSVFFADVFAKHGAQLTALGVNPNNGLGALLEKVDTLPAAQRDAIKADIAAVYAKRPPLAMVDSDKGITNLHVPSDVIIDASMPAA